MGRTAGMTALLATTAGLVLGASPAQAVSYPKEIRGTVGGFNVNDGLNTKWTGTLVLKRRAVDPYTRQPDPQPTYVLASGTKISWQSDLLAPCSGHGEGTLGPGELVGTLTIVPEVDRQFPKYGRRWSVLISPAAPVGQTKRMPVPGTCPDPPRAPRAVVEEARADYLALGYNGYNPNNAHPQNDHTKDLKEFKGLGQATGEFGNQHWEWDLHGAGKLKAVPRASAATRGQKATLDGSHSTPANLISRYAWKFRPVAGSCPDGAPPEAGGKRGRRIKIVVLCDVQAELTVSDAHGDSDTQTTVVHVRARKGRTWVTPFAHREKTTADPDRPKGPPTATTVDGNVQVHIDGAVSVSDCGPTRKGTGILCPEVTSGQRWLGDGYKLDRVDDPGGPFDLYVYVARPRLDVKRAALINASILPGSQFYDYNKQQKADIDGFLTAVRQHEGLGNGQPRTGHSGIIRTLLQKNATNPRRAIEAFSGPSRNKVAEAVDKRLHEVETVLDQQSADPLARIWTGSLSFYDSYLQKWYAGTIHVP